MALYNKDLAERATYLLETDPLALTAEDLEQLANMGKGAEAETAQLRAEQRAQLAAVRPHFRTQTAPAPKKVAPAGKSPRVKEAEAIGAFVVDICKPLQAEITALKERLLDVEATLAAMREVPR